MSRNRVGSKSANLAAARAAKEDEFYTQVADIERELLNYKKHFKGKVIYSNCDDPRVSGFVHYFSHNFEVLGLKNLVATCYKNTQPDLFSAHDSEQAVKLVYSGDSDGSGRPDPSEFKVEFLEGDGDFRSKESIELLKSADIVITNPPFSLYREFISLMIQHGKKFILIGPQNAVTTKEIFPLMMSGQIWWGANSGSMKFRVPGDKEKDGLELDADGNKYQSFGNICWYTNLDIQKRHEELILYKSYSPEAYPKYDNYDAIEVGSVAEIPADYFGVMGVPQSFFAWHNPDQFEIVGIAKTWFGAASNTYPKQLQVNANGSTKEVTKLNDAPALKVSTKPSKGTYYLVNGEIFVASYVRILIRRKHRNEN